MQISSEDLRKVANKQTNKQRRKQILLGKGNRQNRSGNVEAFSYRRAMGAARSVSNERSASRTLEAHLLSSPSKKVAARRLYRPVTRRNSSLFFDCAIIVSSSRSTLCFCVDNNK